MTANISKKVLIISGPTATGKTSLAVKIAQKIKAELISADSRQVYRGMDIGTGKDHPKSIPIHLIDIINPNQSFSSAQFCRLAKAKIRQIHQKSKLPIIVGGTGYYIDSLINSPSTLDIKPHFLTRKILGLLPISVLQLIHQTINRRQYKLLNNSEKHNPHRLIRKLEIKFSRPKKIKYRSDYDYLHICLLAPVKTIYQRIDYRVRSRLDQGLLSEIKSLLKKYKWSDPGLNTLAYQEFKPYFIKKTKRNLRDSIKKWRHHEHGYARRQITWFKKRPEIHRFLINSTSFPSAPFALISKWYTDL